VVPIDKSGFTGNSDHLAILNEAVASGNISHWNAWKRRKDDWVPCLDSDEPPPGDPGEINFAGLALLGGSLRGIDFRGVVLRGANLCGADVAHAGGSSSRR